MNVEIGAESALFPEKEYISGIFVAVRVTELSWGIGMLLWVNVYVRVDVRFPLFTPL